MELNDILKELNDDDPLELIKQLSIAFNLISSWSKEALIEQESVTIDLFNRLINNVIPNKRLNHPSINLENLQNLSQIVLNFFYPQN